MIVIIIWRVESPYICELCCVCLFRFVLYLSHLFFLGFFVVLFVCLKRKFLAFAFSSKLFGDKMKDFFFSCASSSSGFLVSFFLWCMMMIMVIRVLKEALVGPWIKYGRTVFCKNNFCIFVSSLA